MFLAGIYLRVFQMDTCHRNAGMKKGNGSPLLAGGDDGVRLSFPTFFIGNLSSSKSFPTFVIGNPS